MLNLPQAVTRSRSNSSGMLNSCCLDGLEGVCSASLTALDEEGAKAEALAESLRVPTTVLLLPLLAAVVKEVAGYGVVVCGTVVKGSGALVLPMMMPPKGDSTARCC